MPSLESTCELAYRQMYPSPSDETPISREEFIETGRNEAAYQMLLMAWKEKADTGEYNVPSYLLEQVDLDVVNNQADISGLKIIRSLPQDAWSISVGGLTCDCKYVKSNVNLSQLLCDDDSLEETTKTYYFLGQKIYFPKGTHKTPIPFIYANAGKNMDGVTELSQEISAIVRSRLIEIYGGKTGQEDVTNNSSSNN